MAKKKSGVGPPQQSDEESPDQVINKIFVQNKAKKGFTNKAIKTVGKRVTTIGATLGLGESHSDSESIKDYDSLIKPQDDDGSPKGDSVLAVTHDSLFDSRSPKGTNNNNNRNQGQQQSLQPLPYAFYPGSPFVPLSSPDLRFTGGATGQFANMNSNANSPYQQASYAGYPPSTASPVQYGYMPPNNRRNTMPVYHPPNYIEAANEYPPQYYPMHYSPPVYGYPAYAPAGPAVPAPPPPASQTEYNYQEDADRMRYRQWEQEQRRAAQQAPSWGTYIDPVGDQETDRLREEYWRQYERQVQEHQRQVVEEQQRQTQENQHQQNGHYSPRPDLPRSRSSSAVTYVNSRSPSVKTPHRRSPGNMQLNSHNNSSATLVGPDPSLDKQAVFSPKLTKTSSPKEVPVELPENYSKFSAKALMNKIKKRSSPQMDRHAGHRVTSPMVTAPAVQRVNRTPPSPRIIELDDSDHNAAGTSSEENAAKEPAGTVVATAASAGAAAAAGWGIYQSLSSASAGLRNWWTAAPAGGNEDDDTVRSYSRGVPGTFGDVALAPATPGPPATPISVKAPSPEMAMVPTPMPADDSDDSDSEYAPRDLVDDTQYEAEADPDLARIPSPFEETPAQRRFKKTMRMMVRRPAGAATISRPRPASNSTAVAFRAALFQRGSRAIKAAPAAVVVTPSSSPGAAAVSVKSPVPNDPAPSVRAPSVAPAAAAAPATAAPATTKKPSIISHVVRLQSNFVDFLRAWPLPGFIHDTVDRLSKLAPWLQPLVVLIELFIILWTLYLATVLVWSIYAIARAVLIPVILIGKLCGLGNAA